MIKKLYPQGKKKAFVITYDDGVINDIRFVELLNKYHLKGTFNLNSGLMKQQFKWTTDEGYDVIRLDEKTAKALYKGHEVASHSLTHPYLSDWNRQRLFAEISIDKENLETLFHHKMDGFAIPFDYYSNMVIHAVKDAGFKYMRISEVTHNFNIFEDPFHLEATIFHLEPELNDLVNDFINTDQELAVMMIVGHSYDLSVHKLWEKMEDIFKKISNEDDIISMTTSEYIEYINAMKQAQIKDREVINNSPIDLYFEINNKIIKINKNETYQVHCSHL